ncbi:alpha/beta hydrolase [Mycolicibacterium insubricum]|nr:alpha/beta hydrolase [Mycolicibacterium insubricum]
MRKSEPVTPASAETPPEPFPAEQSPAEQSPAEQASPQPGTENSPKKAGPRMPAAVQTALGPITRTGRFYAGAWRHYLGGADTESGLPVARPTVALLGQALRDEIVLTGLRTTRPLSRPKAFQRIDREVHAALDFYGERGFLENPEAFFAAPPELEVAEVEIHKVKGRGRSYSRFEFESSYHPDPDEPGAQRWASYAANAQVYGLLLRHNEPRPWLVCVHGAEMGRAGIDLALFRARHLHEDFGLNVILPVMPLHGPRARDLPRGKAIPGEEVLDDVHFAAQAVWDVRRVLSWIRRQEPAAPIGLNAISLGGYVSSLVASLDPHLTCAILGVPVADLISLLGRHSGFAPGDPRYQTLQDAAPLAAMVTPLSLEPKVPPKGRFIYGGVADRVVHPRDQVVKLWEHWGKPEIVWYRGGHAGFFTARPVQKFVDAALVQSGLVGNR